MRTVVGVDLGERYVPVLKLCLDLAFQEQHITLVHTVEPLPEYAPPLPGDVLDSKVWMTHLRTAGDAALIKAEGLAASSGTATESVVRNGSAAAGLLSVADEKRADLIAVGSLKRSSFGGFMAGSVARAATIGARQSLLVTKGDWDTRPPLKAVFATDHSQYSVRSLDLFLSWAPRGLSQIDVVTAYEGEVAQLSSIQPRHFLVPVDWSKVRASNAGSGEMMEFEGQIKSLEDVERGLQEQCQQVAEKLIAAGFKSEVNVARGHPNTVLADYMRASGADLLIVGAQGHGFVERLFIGSVSLHQVISEPYPVLVIRQ